MSKKKGSGLGKFLLGAGIGAGLGILFAPKAGSETRRELKNKFNELIEKVKDIDVEEVKDTVEAKIYEIKEELASLDKEKVLGIAKEKAQKVTDMAQDLVDYAVEKGTPVIEDTARSVKEKVVTVTKEVLAKFDKE